MDWGFLELLFSTLIPHYMMLTLACTFPEVAHSGTIVADIPLVRTMYGAQYLTMCGKNACSLGSRVPHYLRSTAVAEAIQNLRSDTNSL